MLIAVVVIKVLTKLVLGGLFSPGSLNIKGLCTLAEISALG